MLDGIADRQRAALAETEEDDRVLCARLDHAPQVLHAVILRGRPYCRVGQTSAQLVVPDDASIPGKAAYKPAVAQQLPLQIQMRMHPRHHDNVRWTGSKNLIRKCPARPLRISGF